MNATLYGCRAHFNMMAWRRADVNDIYFFRPKYFFDRAVTDVSTENACKIRCRAYFRVRSPRGTQFRRWATVYTCTASASIYFLLKAVL